MLYLVMEFIYCSGSGRVLRSWVVSAYRSSHCSDCSSSAVYYHFRGQGCYLCVWPLGKYLVKRRSRGV